MNIISSFFMFTQTLSLGEKSSIIQHEPFYLSVSSLYHSAVCFPPSDGIKRLLRSRHASISAALSSDLSPPLSGRLSLARLSPACSGWRDKWKAGRWWRGEKGINLLHFSLLTPSHSSLYLCGAVKGRNRVIE